VSIEPNAQHAGSSDLADTLHKLRKATGLSGERLAARCAMSQSKISRIERGKLLPSVVDVERILTALEVPADAAQKFIALARRAHVEHTSWRSVAEMGLWRKQNELKALTEACAVQRSFLPIMPSGLLQVPSYAKAALSRTVPSAPDRDIDKAAAARLDRQTVLDDTSRQFFFLMTEQAVRWKRVSRPIMVEQCTHMAEISERPERGYCDYSVHSASTVCAHEHLSCL
jgi:transcriptional regulator with XRE-family HTH domain